MSLRADGAGRRNPRADGGDPRRGVRLLVWHGDCFAVRARSRRTRKHREKIMQTKMWRLGMGLMGLTVLAVFTSSVAHGAPRCGVRLECAEAGGWTIQSSKSAPLD